MIGELWYYDEETFGVLTARPGQEARTGELTWNTKKRMPRIFDIRLRSGIFKKLKQNNAQFPRASKHSLKVFSMRPTTKAFYTLFTGLLLALNPSMSFADPIFPPTPDQTIFAVGVDNQTFTSTANPSMFSNLIDTGKTPHADFTYSVQSDMTVYMTTNKDPYINYQMSVTNNSLAEHFYMIAVGIGISPQNKNSDFQNDLKVTTSGIGSINLTPTYDGVHASSGLQRELLSTDSGVTFNPADEFGPLGTAITSAGTTSYSFTQDLCDNTTPPSSNTSPPPTPTVTYNYMELLVGFNLSAGTTATFYGSESLTVCPEPSTLVMAFIAAIMVVGFNVRSHFKPRWKARRGVGMRCSTRSPFGG